jgi:rubrerythrin
MENIAMQLSDNEFTIPLFFEVCAKIEGQCAELYHYYSALHHENEELSQIWKKTALEEENHQKQFELAFRLRDDVKFELKVELERAKNIYGKLSNLIEHVRQNPPDIVTALTRAIEMEESLADLHLDCSVNFHDESVSRIFQALKDYDQDHVKSLRHFQSIMTLASAEMAG